MNLCHLNLSLRSVRCAGTLRRARLALLFSFACVLCSSFINARVQDQVDRAATNARAKGSITGRVVSDEGQPLVGVTVAAFTPSRPGPPHNTVSDANGKFTLNDLDSAAYNLSVSAPGYVSESEQGIDSSERDYYRTGDSVTLRMLKGGVITGTVTNASGEPLVGVHINILRVHTLDGRLVSNGREGFFGSTQRQTDDRGVYRIYGLRPGSYIVSAGGKGLNWFEPTAFDADAPTYYPSSTRDTAAEVTVQPGQETTNIDIRYRAEQGHTISGTIVGGISSEQTAGSGGVSVSLNYADTNMVAAFAFVQNNAGTRSFAFDGVADGDYDVMAETYSARESGNAALPTRVNVRGADVTGIKLALAPLASINGRLIIEAAKETASKTECQTRRPTLPEEIVIFARRDEPAAATPKQQQTRAPLFSTSQSTPDNKGEFTLRNLNSGRYRLNIRLPGDDLYIRSITQMGAPPNPRQATDNTPNIINLKMGDRLNNLHITVANGAAALSGRVALSEGATLPAGMRIYLVPAERERIDDVLRYVESPLRSDGTFMFKNLAPGRYLTVVARPDSDKEAASRLFDKDAAARAKLRLEAERQKNAVELQPCQYLESFTLPFNAPVK